MMIYQNFAVKLITVVAIALSNLLVTLPARAVTQDLQLKSDRGYRIEASFGYNDELQETISERGKGEANAVDFMQVRFYDREDNEIASYDNILDGVVQGNYFEFNYDPGSQQLLGNVDLGGEAAGEIYLKGNVEEGFALIEVEPSGSERTIDSGKWLISDRS